MDVSPINETEHVGTVPARIEHVVFKGYRTQQSITIRSGDVNRVERISREVTKLLEKGVPITSSAPSYHYTKLGELKIQLTNKT